MSAREELARAQAELLRALGEGGPVPEGFDAARLRATADALVAKRRRLVERAWPGLVALLGERFAGDFEAWAREHPLRDVEPHPGVEARRFAEALRATGRLPPQAEGEIADFDLRWRLTREGGLAARRGLGWALVREGPSRRVLRVRLPGGRVWGVRLPG